MKRTILVDDRALEVWKWLDRMQKNNNTWYSVNEVRQGVKRNYAHTELALQLLIQCGLMHVKHEPSEPTRLLYRLRREGDVL